MVGFVTSKERPDLGGNIRHGDIHTFAPVLWRFLVERFGIRSVLDVGCGEGHAVLFFERLGIKAHGIDGLRENVEQAVTPIAQHDLLVAPYIMPVDLVWSSEVAEHIAPEKVDNYIDTLANGRFVAMSAARAGQGGYHHVNCQPKEYWIDLMAQRGYIVSPDNEIFAEVAKSDPTRNHFAQNGIVFVRTDDSRVRWALQFYRQRTERAANAASVR
jgi:cyclopropane fatty-acyl-phospholipid synthase-like methyltransferase